MPLPSILIHDYSGHPFQIQLSRELARRGRTVCHVYCRSFLTPHGALDRTPDDPATLSIRGLALGEMVDKQSYLKRRRQEVHYGKLLAALISDLRPDLVISANAPLDSLRLALAASRRVGAKFVFWMQDVYSVAIASILGHRLGWAGRLIGAYYTRMEAHLVRKSDHLVVITDDFLPLIRAWGVADSKATVIPNWASTAEIPSLPKENPWSLRQELHKRFCFLYSGTLGMKHNPNLLLQLAIAFRHEAAVKVVVVSEGAGAQWLQQQKATLGLDNLELLPFQPYEELPAVLGAADVLIAILEPDAGVFSVPSKVLSYLCAGRALLLAVPAVNLAARIVSGNQAGFAVEPVDAESFVTQARHLFGDAPLRVEMGENALQYAQRNFDLGGVTDMFEEVIDAAMSNQQ